MFFDKYLLRVYLLKTFEKQFFRASKCQVMYLCRIHTHQFYRFVTNIIGLCSYCFRVAFKRHRYVNHSAKKIVQIFNEASKLKYLLLFRLQRILCLFPLAASFKLYHKIRL